MIRKFQLTMLPLIVLYLVAGVVGKVDVRHSETNKAFMETLTEGEYEVVHPFQIRDKSERVGIDTRNYFKKAAEHYQHVTIVVRSGSAGRLKLVLERNDYIFVNQTSFRKLDSNGEHGISTPIENCFYQGSIAGDPNSFVALSTCNGLKGILAFSNGTAWGLWPLDGGDRGRRHPHVLYRAEWRHDAKCGAALAGAANLRTLRHHEHRHRGSRDVSRQTKYIEVAALGDYEFAKKNGLAEWDTLMYMLETVNVADSMLSRDLNIRLSVVYSEMWLDVERVDLLPDIERTVAGVVDYSAGHIYNIQKDATIFFTGGSFANNEAANGIFRSICTARAATIVKVPDVFSSQWSAQLLSQSIGHLLGLDHDTPSCQCDMGSSCVMNPHPGHTGAPFAFQFSKCSIARMHGVWQAGQVHCLLNKPFQVSQHRECGNGVVDGSEECDCGPRETCNDPCCDPLTCTLRAHAQCAAHHACCHRCELRKAGEICRTSKSACDVAEVCDGESGDCPADGFLIDGTTCGEDGQCWRGNCSDPQAQCKQLWGSDAKVADIACFDKNMNGYNYANCGTGPDGPKACLVEDTRCGTLHCEGGSAMPHQGGLNAFTFQFLNKDRQVQCKSIADSVAGQSMDGSSCGSGRVCVAGSCVEMSSVSQSVACPSNNHALQCSGHGDCTTTSVCVCFAGWGGRACDVRTNSTLYKHRDDKKQTVIIPTIAAGKSLDTATLLGILLLVGVFLLLLLVCLLFCYRRRSVVEIPVPSDEKLDDSLPDQTQRSIKFGNMPSYREEKRQYKSNKHIYSALNRITEAEENASLRSRDSGSQGAGSQLLFEPRAIPSSRSDVGVPCSERSHDHIYAESAVGITYRNGSPLRRRHDGFGNSDDAYGMRSFNWREPQTPSTEMTSDGSPHHIPSPLRLNINRYPQMLQNISSKPDSPRRYRVPSFDDDIPPFSLTQPLKFEEDFLNSDLPPALHYPEDESSAVEADHELGSNTESSRGYELEKPPSDQQLPSPDHQPPTSARFDFRKSPNLFRDDYTLELSNSMHREL